MKRIIHSILLLSLLWSATSYAKTTHTNEITIQLKKGQECAQYKASWLGDKTFRIKINDAKRLMIYGPNQTKLQNIQSPQYAYSSADGKVVGEFQTHTNSYSYGFFNKGTIRLTLNSLEKQKHNIMFCFYDW